MLQLFLFSFNVCLVLQIEVPEALFDTMEEIYAPPNDEVFELVPPVCAHHITVVYKDIGSPDVNNDTFWGVYSSMHGRFQELADEAMQEAFRDAFEAQYTNSFEAKIDILPDQQPYYNINNDGTDHEYADFTDNEDDDSEEDDWDGEDEQIQHDFADFTDDELNGNNVESADFSDFSDQSEADVEEMLVVS
jgi:hypothetical protein